MTINLTAEQIQYIANEITTHACIPNWNSSAGNMKQAIEEVLQEIDLSEVK